MTFTLSGTLMQPGTWRRIMSMEQLIFFSFVTINALFRATRSAGVKAGTLGFGGDLTLGTRRRFFDDFLSAFFSDFSQEFSERPFGFFSADFCKSFFLLFYDEKQVHKFLTPRVHG